MNSEQFGLNLLNSEPTDTETLHTPSTSTSTMPDMTIPTNTAEKPKKTNKKSPLPGPDIPTSEKLEDKKSRVAKEETPFDTLTPAQQKLAEKYASIYAMMGVFLSARDTYDGMVLIGSAQKRAEELVRAARHDKRVMKVLEKIANSSDIGSALLGHGLMLYAILAHHGRIKKNDMLLIQLGYHETQVLGEEASANGSNATGNVSIPV